MADARINSLNGINYHVDRVNARPITKLYITRECVVRAYGYIIHTTSEIQTLFMIILCLKLCCICDIHTRLQIF